MTSPFDAQTAEALRQRLNGHADKGLSPVYQTAAIKVFDAGDIDPKKIRPRGWLLGTTFCRKLISGVIGDGGVGKTALRYAQFLAGAAGRKDITGEYVHHRFRTLIVCLEDDLDEVQKRIAAAMLHHNVSQEDVAGWLLYCTPQGLKLLSEGVRGVRQVGELHNELDIIIEALKIDLVSIDPFVKSHGVSENDNDAIDQVCVMLAGLGVKHKCAIDLTSHARKGSATPGDADHDRGASAKKDAGRLVRTLTPMSGEEAKQFGLSDDDRSSLVRLDDGKVNIEKKSAEAMWFRLVGVKIGNVTLDYPAGDTVQTVERWDPPEFKLSIELANQILDAIDKGPAEGRRYSPAPQAKDRPAWPVVQEFCPTWNDKQCRKVIADWINNKTLKSGDYHDLELRKDVKGLFIGIRPGSDWDV
jgi:hypothetical protein